MTALLTAARKRNGEPDPNAAWLPMASAARLVNVSPQTVYNYVKRNEVHSKNRGGKTLVSVEDVRRMAAQKYERYPVPATRFPAPTWSEPAAEISEETTVMTTTPASDRLTLARRKVDAERRELAEARRSREEQIERLRGELELLLVRESELDDALKAIETIERLTL